jgi:hypothetical protein
MSTDFSIRPVGAPVPAPVVQPLSKAADNAVATELPVDQSVTVAEAGARLRNDPGPATDGTSHQITFDRDAASIVFQVRDKLTNTVVDQFPDEAVLRRRTYFRSLEVARSTPTRLAATDRKA